MDGGLVRARVGLSAGAMGRSPRLAHRHASALLGPPIYQTVTDDLHRRSRAKQ
jgi:hypothetical protein